MQKARHLALRANEYWDRADAEGRPLTTDERYQVEQLVARAKEAQEIEQKLREIDGDVTWEHGDSAAGKGPGDQFVESKGYRDLMARGLGSGNWSTGQVELQTKATLATTPGTALTPAGYVPGVVETLFQRPYLADLFPNQQAPGNPVRFVSETTATNAAAAVAEQGQKPESTLVFGETSEPVRKIATFLPVSDEMLEDAPQIQAYLNAACRSLCGKRRRSRSSSGTAPRQTCRASSQRAALSGHTPEAPSMTTRRRCSKR